MDREQILGIFERNKAEANKELHIRINAIKQLSKTKQLSKMVKTLKMLQDDMSYYDIVMDTIIRLEDEVSSFEEDVEASEEEEFAEWTSPGGMDA